MRPSDWQFGIGVQQEILPRTSIEVSYNRRWFNDFFVFKNTLLTPDDFSSQTITAPLNANLPGGGGYPMTYQVLNPGVPTNIQDLYTSANNYGGESVYWHGVDITISSRMHNGFTFQGGTSTGRGVTDFCALAAQMPEIYNPALTNAANNLASTPYQPASSCHVAENWLTQFRGLASYQIPKVDVLFSADRAIEAERVDRADRHDGRDQWHVAGRELHQCDRHDDVQPRPARDDLRSARQHRRSPRREGAELWTVQGDGWRAISTTCFNSNTGLTFNQNYGTGSNYLVPMTILTPRFIRFNATVDF